MNTPLARRIPEPCLDCYRGFPCRSHAINVYTRTQRVPEWLRRAREGTLPAKDMTGAAA